MALPQHLPLFVTASATCRPAPCQNRRRLLSLLLSTTSIISTMFFLLLVYFLTQSNLSGDASPIPLMERRADISCNDLNQCRTIWSIIWSCLLTVLLCTWVTLHPNISISPDKRGFVAKLSDFLKNKLPLFLCALIAPEYILAWAIRQYLEAGRIQRRCSTRQTSMEHPAPVREWTRTHGFFLIMGGFHLYSLPDGAISGAYPPELSIPSKFVLPLPGHSREGGKAEHPLDFQDLSTYALAYFAPSETEIKDKGKADIIAKILVILQTSWFVAQCIARGVKHLPLTDLEVVTLAYATMNMFIYYFWWDKPKDVECPVRVYKALSAGGVERGGKEWERWIFNIIAYVIGQQDKYSQLSEERQVPMFWSGKPGDSVEWRSMYIASILGMIFGVVHFIAWNSEFPSYIELLLWRVSCVAMIAVPLTISIFCSMSESGVTMGDTADIVIYLFMFSLPLTALLYFFARIATLVMVFSTLRALPPGAFETVDWANFIHHL